MLTRLLATTIGRDRYCAEDGMIDGFVCFQECPSLRAALDITAVISSQPSRNWRLSGVDRRRLADGT